MEKMVIESGRTIKVNNRLYYRVKMQCPVCLERGLNPEMKYWRHGECGGDLYVGGNAFYLCERCDDYGHVSEYGYSCPIHNKDDRKEYIQVKDLKYLGVAVSTAAQSMAGNDEAGLDFLEEFIINLRKRVSFFD